MAPAQTVDREHCDPARRQHRRALREIGVDTGGPMQFSVNPADGRMIVIEMNLRTVPRRWLRWPRASDRQGGGCWPWATSLDELRK